MHVLVNESSAFKAKAGIGHYTAELLLRLRAQASGDVIEGFPGPWFRRASSLGRGLLSRLSRQPAARSGPVACAPAEKAPNAWRAWCDWQARRAGWGLLAAHLRGRIGSRKIDLYHEPNNIPLCADVPTIATIHDLSVVLHPEWHPAYRAAEYQARFAGGLARCSHVLTVSEFIRQELVHILGIPPGRVTRVPLGVRAGLGPMPAEEVRAALHALGLPPRYFLYLGTIEPRKNVMTLLRAYVKLPAEVRERFPLLLAGGWGWNSNDVAAFLDGEARHRGVLYTGYLPERDLAAVLNGARALVYPSLYEGFGLPPVEMMACGGAVLCSTAGALVETVGGRAHLVEPLDEDGWREALRRAAVDDDWHAELRRGAVDIVRPYTWERCAAETLAVYRAVDGRTEAEGPGLRQAG